MKANNLSLSQQAIEEYTQLCQAKGIEVGNDITSKAEEEMRFFAFYYRPLPINSPEAQEISSRHREEVASVSN